MSKTETPEKVSHVTRMFGEFTLDLDRALLLKNGHEVKLRPKSFEALKYLVEHPGRVVSKGELIQAIWPDTFVTDDSLVQCLRDVRLALGSEGQRFIKTSPRRGYIFDADVTSASTRSNGLNEATPIDRVIVVGDVPKAALREDTSHIEFGSLHQSRWKLNAKWLVTSILFLGVAALVSYFWLSRGSRNPKQPSTIPDVHSVAVLPFRPIDGNSNDEYLGLGMADTLINKLSKVHQIVIRPTSAIRKYSETDQDPVAVGHEQRVDAVLEGSIQKSGGQLRVTARLLNAQDGSTFWAGQFDEKLTDIFAVEDSIADQLTRTLALKLSSDEQHRLDKRDTENLEARQAFLKGRYFWEKRTPEGLGKALGFFEQSLQLDPNYALAYTGLADCYVALWGTGVKPASEMGEKIRAAAHRALELDDTLGQAHTDMACYYTLEYDLQAAEREHTRANELSPNYPTAHLWYGYLLQALGRQEENLAERKRAQELDPLNLSINNGIANAIFHLGHYKEAEEQLQKTLELNPDYEPAHSSLGGVYFQQGRYREAIAEFQKGHDRDDLAFVYAVSGKKPEAHKELAELLKAQAKHDYGSACSIALIYVGLGDKDKAIEWLEKAYRQHEPSLLFIKVDQRFISNLGSDPRFQGLLKRVGLT